MPQGGRYLRHFLARLVTQGIDNLLILKLFRHLLGVGFESTPQIRRNTFQARVQFSLFCLQFVPQLVVFVIHNRHYNAQGKGVISVEALTSPNYS